MRSIGKSWRWGCFKKIQARGSACSVVGLSSIGCQRSGLWGWRGAGDIILRWLLAMLDLNLLRRLGQPLFQLEMRRIHRRPLMLPLVLSLKEPLLLLLDLILLDCLPLLLCKHFLTNSLTEQVSFGHTTSTVTTGRIGQLLELLLKKLIVLRLLIICKGGEQLGL